MTRKREFQRIPNARGGDLELLRAFDFVVYDLARFLERLPRM
jgi:hypothetical protein